jgi:hypothetical protein
MVNQEAFLPFVFNIETTNLLLTLPENFPTVVVDYFGQRVIPKVPLSLIHFGQQLKWAKDRLQSREPLVESVLSRKIDAEEPFVFYPSPEQDCRLFSEIPSKIQ